MAKWEFAAIVSGSGSKWALRTHGKSTRFDCTIELVVDGGGASKIFTDFKQELQTKKGLAKVKKKNNKTVHVIFSLVDTWDKAPSDLASEIEAISAIGETWSSGKFDGKISHKVICDYKSQMTLFEADDLLVLVNLAGAEGWEITGGLGLNDGYWQHINDGGPVRETRWRMMRREL